MAFYDGMLGAGQSAIAFGQQRFQNNLAKEEFELEKSKFRELTRQYDQNYELQQKNYNLNARGTKVAEDQNRRADEQQAGILQKQKLENEAAEQTNNETRRKQIYRDNDTLIGSLTDLGIINMKGEFGPTRLDIPNTVKRIEEGGAPVDQAILAMANRGGDLPEGFTLNKVDRTQNGFVLRGTYEDGRSGVITAEGSTRDDDEVVFLTAQQVAGLMDDEYRTNIRGNSNLGASSATVEYLVGAGMTEADAAEVVNRETALNTLQTQVVGEVTAAAEDPATGDGKNVGMVRAFKAALASAETDEDKLQILTDQAQAFGIEVPEILLKPSPVKGEDPVRTRLAEAGITPEKWARLTDEEKQEAVDVLNIREGLETVGKWAARPFAPAVDALLALPKASVNVATRFANSKVGKALGLSEVGDKPTYSDKAEFTKAWLKDITGSKPDITVDQANVSFTAIPNQPADVRQAAQKLETGLFARINEMTPEEAVSFVDTYGLKPTAEDEKNLTTVLQSAGVQTAADINKLPTKAQVNVRSWLRSMAIQRGDTAAAEKLREELVALGSGSGRADASALELQNLAVDQLTAKTGAQNAATNLANYNLNVQKHFHALDVFSNQLKDENRKRAVDRQKRLAIAVYGETDGVLNDSINFDKNKLFQTVGGVGGVFGQAYSDWDKASGPEKQGLQMELNTIISVAFQAMAESEEYGKFFENFLPDGGIDSIDGSDFWASRLVVTERNKEGKPTRFGVVDLGSRQQVDETIPASAIKNLFGVRGYNFIVKQVK